MRQLLGVAILLITALLIRPQDQSSTACSPGDQRGIEMLSYLRQLVVSTDEDEVQLRKVVGLPTIDSSQVVLATNTDDATVCERARQVYVANFKTDTLTVPSVYVFKIGTGRFAVMGKSVKAAGHDALEVFDGSFNYLGGIL